MTQLILLGGSTILSYGQGSKASQTGIAFVNGDFAKVQQMAESTGKTIFVEIYLTGCPHCEALAPVLKEPSVGKFYNQEFISWKTEANSAESKAFQRLKNVTYPEFPLLFFFSPTGEMIHMATPQEQQNRQDFINELISIGQIAKDPKQRTGGYLNRLNQGERDPLFLISFGKYAKATKDAGRLSQINDLLSQVLNSDQDKESKLGFYVIQHLANNYSNPLATYFFSHLDSYREKYPAKEVKEAGEAILYHTLYGSTGDIQSIENLAKMRSSMISLGVSEDEALARMLLKELDAYFRASDTKGALGHFAYYRKINISLSLADYAYIMKYFNEKATDHSYLDQMPVWAKEGLSLAKPGDLKSKPAAMLYYELAESYRKAGQSPQAQTNARQALEVARSSGDDIKRYETLLATIQTQPNCGR